MNRTAHHDVPTKGRAMGRSWMRRQDEQGRKGGTGIAKRVVAGGVIASLAIVGTASSAYGAPKPQAPAMSAEAPASTDTATVLTDLRSAVARLESIQPTNTRAVLPALDEARGAADRAVSHLAGILRKLPNVEEWIIQCVEASGTVRDDGPCAPGASSGVPSVGTSTGGGSSNGGGTPNGGTGATPSGGDPLAGPAVCDKAGPGRPQGGYTRDDWGRDVAAWLRSDADVRDDFAEWLDPIGQALGDGAIGDGGGNLSAAVTAFGKAEALIAAAERAVADAIEAPTQPTKSAEDVAADQAEANRLDDEDVDADTTGENAPRGNSTPLPGEDGHAPDYDSLCDAWQRTAWIGNPELLRRLHEGPVVNNCQDPVVNPAPVATGTESASPSRTIACPGATAPAPVGSTGCTPQQRAAGGCFETGNGVSRTSRLAKLLIKLLPTTFCNEQVCTGRGDVLGLKLRIW